MEKILANLPRHEVINELWRRGNLSFKLDKNQQELYKLFHESKFKVQTWLLARRNGKSHTLSVLAIEQCVRHPNSIVKFVSPTKLQVNNNLRPLFKKILSDCPDELRPEFKTNTYIYYFPNGSEIQLAGTENGHAEKLRGSDSHISIVDEAGSCKDLDNLVKSILLPTTLTTKGKVLLASTPPMESEHDFLKFIEEAEMRGSLVKKTIDDNPRLTFIDKEELIKEMGGINTAACQRELFCKIVHDSSTSVIPEFTEELEKEITKEWPKPPFYDAYEAMDLGGKDLTAVLFGYFDFRADKVIIEDELILDFSLPDIGIRQLSEGIKEKENLHWLNFLTNEVKKPYMRVSDINYIVTQEIRKVSNNEINFEITKKDDLQTAINDVRSLLTTRKLIIHPRCKTLLRHLRNIKWKSPNNKTVFGRSPDNGHYDAVAALIYFVRSIIYTKNPYPAHYNLNLKDLYVNNPENFYKRDKDATYRAIFNVKKKMR